MHNIHTKQIFEIISVPLLNFPQAKADLPFEREQIMLEIKNKVKVRYDGVFVGDGDQFHDLVIIMNIVPNIHISRGRVHVFEEVKRVNVQFVILVKVLPKSASFPNTDEERKFVDGLVHWCKGLILTDNVESVLHTIEEYLNEVGISTST